MSADTSADGVKAKLEEARKNVTECDKDMQMLKRKIRDLGTDGGDPNSLELVVLKVSRRLTKGQTTALTVLTS